MNFLENILRERNQLCQLSYYLLYKVSKCGFRYEFYHYKCRPLLVNVYID